jgi:hypothetical protein
MVMNFMMVPILNKKNTDEYNAEKYTTVGRLAQLKQNEMTATRMH